MNKDLLYEEEKRRFQQILEFTMHGSNANREATYNNSSMIVDEADDNQEQPDDNAPSVDMNAGGSPMDGAMSPDAGAEPGGDMNTMPPMDGGTTGQGGDMGAGAPMDGGMGPDAGAAPGGDGQNQQTPEGFNPQEDPNAPGMEGDVTPEDFEGGDDDVVDVTDLTDAQEETEETVKHMGAKFEKAFKYLKQWEDKIKETQALIQANNEKIDSLKDEFEKRNPTQIEKLSMQTAKSGPFNVTPEEYWDKKEATSNYRTEDDNNGVGQEQYTITKNDIDGTTDWKGIADTLDDDTIYHPTLKNTMGNW